MSKAFESMMRGAEEALRHAEGQNIGTIHKIMIPDHDVRKIRLKTGLSQSQFADSIGVTKSSLQNWEQGKRKPLGAARVLLALLDRDPEIVQKMLR